VARPVTIAVALLASDGVVLASDSMGSDVTIASTQQKVRVCAPLPLAWAFAGSVYLGQAVRRAMDDLAAAPPSGWAAMTGFEILDELLGRVRPAVKDAVAALREGGDPTGLELLFVGTAADGPFVAVVHQDLSAVLEDEQNLVPIGAARTFAAALRQALAHYLVRRPAVRHALPLACRAVDAVCQVSAYGVAPPVQVAVVDADGARLLSVDEVGALDEQVQAWLAAESATLYGSDAAPAVVPRLQRQRGDLAG
jgi:20S proteasome alpha/beta subunit